MKKLLILLIAAGVLCGCDTAGQIGDDTVIDSQDTAQDTVQGREDREIMDDYASVSPSGVHDVRILFVNAGKADCILLEVDDYTALIDTGTSASPAVILPALESMQVDSIDAVFFTHTDKDHVGGFETIAEQYPVSVCYTSSISAEWSTFESVIGEREHIALDPGAVVELTDGVWLEVMGPIRYNPDENENSLVLRLRVNGVTALFTGDMKYNEETSLIYNEMPLDCDILKVPYHGRIGATSVKFIESTTPSLAVITTDRAEDEDSAHENIVNALEDSGAAVYITDETTLGVLVEIGGAGEVEVTSLEAAEKPKDVRIVSVSKSEQTVVLENGEEEAVDLSGWHIVSLTGGELFRFPDGAVIEAGGSVTVACSSYTGASDYTWQDTRVWHKSKADPAVLYDRQGAQVATKESE